MIKKLTLSLFITVISSYTMEEITTNNSGIYDVLLHRIVPYLCSENEPLLSSSLVFKERLGRFCNQNYDNKAFLYDENTKDRLLLFTTFEDALAKLSLVQNLMLVDKRSYTYIKATYQDQGIIKDRYNNIALTLKQYRIVSDIHAILDGFVDNTQLQVAFEQLTMVSNHPKTLNFFGYITDWNNGPRINFLIDGLINIHKQKAFNIFKHEIYLTCPAQHEIILIKIIKNLIVNFCNKNTINGCECSNYIDSVSSLLHPEITIINNYSNFYLGYITYGYILMKNENFNSEETKD